MRRTCIGTSRRITIGPIAKSSTQIISLQCDVTSIFVYIIEEVAHAHVQNVPLEWFSSIPAIGVVPRLLSQICWLRVR